MTKLAALVFPGFELLDLFGPLELFGSVDADINIAITSGQQGPVGSTQGPRVMTDCLLKEALDAELFLIPGGPGIRNQIRNEDLLGWLNESAKTADMMMSVCTGSALLAAAGLLDGRRATTNKLSFSRVARTGKNTQWIKQTRWVEDGKYWTSSGVSAGMDMALAVIERKFGRDCAKKAAIYAEYDWHNNPDWDPFAEIHGLV
ncbi:DJ-1/PfpI family protein [Aestuariispira insulae]|uniref:DJ-1/PfpI family protein n=1 Tax=Aestuariispira insulae TaxID=1461337 RepID=A0A3D9HJV0_9PROT|nr:DJ-1/PfpI family protein [Aestuariispira insulae]RED49748.1 DJ-1/PfpI family protein [Aestuariispira insulae]